MASFSASALTEAALSLIVSRAPATAMNAIMGSTELRDGLLAIKAGAEDALGAIARETDPARLLSKQGALAALLTTRKKAVLETADRSRRLDASTRAFLGSALDVLSTVANSAGKAFSVKE